MKIIDWLLGKLGEKAKIAGLIKALKDTRGKGNVIEILTFHLP